MNVSSELPPEKSLMLAAECGWFTWRDGLAILLTCIVWSLLAFLIDPRGDFPMIDDLSYGLPVRALVERGDFRLTDWSTATVVLQALWGALFCLPAGFSFTTLRISTLVAGLIGLVATYGLMRQYRARPAVALFATWVLGTNPIYLCLSYTFMTDVPFISLFVLSSFLLIRGMVRDDDRAIWLGLAAALGSVFIRQIGVAVFLGFAAAYPFWRGPGRRWFVQALLPALLAFVALKAYERGLTSLGRMPRFYTKANDWTVHYLAALAKGKLYVLGTVPGKVWRVLEHLGQYSLPLSLLCWPSRLARLSRRGRVVELGLVTGLTLLAGTALVLAGDTSRSVGNIVYDFGVGPRFGGPDSERAGWPGQLPSVLSAGHEFVTSLGIVLALLALAQVVRRIATRPRNPPEVASRACAIFLIASCAFYNGPIIFSYLYILLLYDRYTIAILVMALALIWKGMQATGQDVPDEPLQLRPIGVAAGLVSLMAYLAFGIAATHDYLDWSRVRWETDLSLARELAIPASDIDGGWEYNYYQVCLDRLYMSSRERELVMDPVEKKDEMWCKRVDRPYRVSAILTPGYEAIRKVPLSPWLPLAPREFIVSRRIDPSSPAR